MNILGAAAFIVVPILAAVCVALWKAWRNTSQYLRYCPIQTSLPDSGHTPRHDEHLVGAR